MLAITVTTFFAVGLGVVGLYQVFTARRQQIVERVQRYAALVPTVEELAREPVSLPGEKGEGGRMERLLQRFRLPRLYLAFVEGELAKTTILLRPQEFALGAVGTGLGVFLLLYLLGAAFILQLAGGALGFYAWHLVLRSAKRRRVRLFDQQVVEALTMMSNGLKAGYSFLQAAELVAAEMEPPISTEFKRLMRETNLGVNVETALLEMAQRVESEDMELVVTAILIQRQVGGNLAEILNTISHTIRERVRLQNELRTLTAQGKLSGLILMLLPPGVGAIIFTMNPQFLMVLFVEPLGRMLLFLALIMQVLGILFIRRIVSLEV